MPGVSGDVAVTDTPLMLGARDCWRCPSDSFDVFPIVEGGVVVAKVWRCRVCGDWSVEGGTHVPVS